jgi:transposase
LTDKELIKQLLRDFEILKKENIALRLRIVALENKLSKYENPKNSCNSSVAPSQDPYRKTKSLRCKSNKPQGGQKGHQGSKLEMVATPNTTVIHAISQCDCCGNNLPKNNETYDARQVFDLPPIKIQVTEHRAIQKTCRVCGTQNTANFPEGVTQKTQYGNNLKSLCVYLQNYQMLPYARCKEFIADLTGHNMSTGSLSNFQAVCVTRLEGYEQEIKKQLLQSPILHADETGIRLKGKTSWMHVMSNKSISYFAHHLNRGRQAMDEIGLLALYKGTLIHDRFSSYFGYGCEHSLCNAHILRDLNYVEETFNATWARQIKELLLDAKKTKEKNPNLKASYFSKIFNNYVSSIRPVIKKYDKKYTKTDEERLAFALEKHKYLILKFIEKAEIPFDNNQAERDLRMIKVKQKVSGCFRAKTQASYFACIRGYITTLKKNKENVLENIQNAFLKNPFIPVGAE